MITGKVNRPAFGEGDGKVRLTATLTRGSETKTIVYEATVKEQGMTDTQIVTADKLALEFPVDVNNIRSDIALPILGENGSVITWESNKTSLISNTGGVIRPVNGADPNTGNVTMTATLTKGSIVETKTFDCKVIPWTDEEEVDLDVSLLTWDKIKGSNLSITDVVYDLVLPAKGEKETTITWISNNVKIVSNTGVVTRPSYIEGDTVIALSATVSKGSANKTVNILGIKVVKKAITNQEAAEKAVNGMDANDFLGKNISLQEITESMILPGKSKYEDCGSVSFVWTVVQTDETTPDPTNKYARISRDGIDYLCTITRPTTNEENASVIIKCTGNSNLEGAGQGQTSKVFRITVLKNETRA